MNIFQISVFGRIFVISDPEFNELGNGLVFIKSDQLTGTIKKSNIVQISGNEAERIENEVMTDASSRNEFSESTKIDLNSNKTSSEYRDGKPVSPNLDTGIKVSSDEKEQKKRGRKKKEN